jgi:hypothetical protein
MTTPTHSTPVTGSPRMTPERWRTVDAILQAALACEPERRDTIIAAACGSDLALQIEVESLLAAHADTDFLERPAAEVLGAHGGAWLAGQLAALQPAPVQSAEPDAETAAHLPTPGRTVSAHAALYVAIAALVVGLAGGLLTDRSSFVRRWTDDAPVVTRPSANVAIDVSPATAGVVSLSVVDRTGHMVHGIPADGPWTPRFSPDGRRVAYGAIGSGRNSHDLWITDLNAGTTRRITDDDADANDPQWSPDGTTIAYSANAPGGKDLMRWSLASGERRVLAARPGTQFPSDWLRDGSALLVTDDAGQNRHDILVQPADGSPARPYAATSADETAARISPDGRWVAYTSDESGRAEVYMDSYPRAGRRVTVSLGGGVHPVWRGDGRELYYWRDGALVAVPLNASVGGKPPARGAESVLFRAPYLVGLNTMYDVSRDGKQFVIVRQQ